MTINPLAVRSPDSSVFDLDRRTQQALVEQINRIKAQVELGRETTDALSHIFVYSKYQISLALMTTQAIEDSLAAVGVPAEKYLAYFQMLEHDYLQQMATATHKGALAINR